MKTWVEGIRQRDRRALSKAITLLESSQRDDLSALKELFSHLFPHKHVAQKVGVTGIPGVGKSTFIASMVEAQLKANSQSSIAILTVDPSSPVSGGSILGDRVRMSSLEQHSQVFIRTSPSRGHLGGLAHRTYAVVSLLEAAGFDHIWIESVGVGQSEVELAQLVDLVILLQMPATGDDIQAMKKGVNEICDMMVIHKADGELKPLAEKTARLWKAHFHGAHGAPLVETLSSHSKEACASLSDVLSNQWFKKWNDGALKKKRDHQNQVWLEQEMLLLLKEYFHTPEWKKLCESNEGSRPSMILAESFSEKIFRF